MRQFPKFVVLQMLRGYKWAISPLLPPACRFVPTCSEYAQEAVERYGALRGVWMGLMRLLRCHPFSGGGYDPVERHHLEMCCERPTTDGQRPTTPARAI
jgi:putative membrane protein insertion efficiency factor